MSKLFIPFVIITAGTLLLVSGCYIATDSSAEREEGWMEMKPLEGNDSSVINPDDYK